MSVEASLYDFVSTSSPVIRVLLTIFRYIGPRCLLLTAFSSEIPSLNSPFSLTRSLQIGHFGSLSTRIRKTHKKYERTSNNLI